MSDKDKCQEGEWPDDLAEPMIGIISPSWGIFQFRVITSPTGFPIGHIVGLPYDDND